MDTCDVVCMIVPVHLCVQLSPITPPWLEDRTCCLPCLWCVRVRARVCVCVRHLCSYCHRTVASHCRKYSAVAIAHAIIATTYCCYCCNC